MAKTKLSKTTQPAHRFIRIDLNHTSPNTANDFGYYEDFHYVDLAGILSAINSRLYRQGMMYHIANISVHDRQGGWTKFCTVPNTWPVMQAWKKGFEKWLQMNYESMDEATLRNVSRAARWSDYRVYFNSDHKDDADKAEFVDVEGNTINFEEQNYTKYTSTDGNTADEFTAHIMGGHLGSAPNRTSVSLLEAYAEIVNHPDTEDTSVNVANGVWANLLENEGASDDIIVDLKEDYDAPPYDKDCFPGGKVGFLSNSPAPWSVRETDFISPNRIAMVGGFEVPFGLLCIETSNTSGIDNTIGLIIELVPGPYKGILAEPVGTPRLKDKTQWKVS